MQTPPEVGSTVSLWAKEELGAATVKADSDAILLSGQCDAAQKAKNKREAK